jgi:glycosyltransferase involved in cell wall biosynthesis
MEGNRSDSPDKMAEISVKKPTITLLIPVLNEIEGLKQFLPQIDRSLFDNVLIMDGRSTDGSWQYCLEQGVDVFTQVRKGLANGYYDAIRLLDTDYVILFSPDGNCLSENLPQIVEKIRQGYDLVVVSRYREGARSEDDNWVTAFGNWMFSFMMRWLGGKKADVTDALNIYRGFRSELILSADFARILQGPVFEPLVTGMCILQNRPMIEIPGDEPKRIGGVSKMSVSYNGSCLLLMVIRLYLLRIFGLRV